MKAKRVPKLEITLNQVERDALKAMADEEVRRPSQQAAVLIRRGLRYYHFLDSETRKHEEAEEGDWNDTGTG